MPDSGGALNITCLSPDSEEEQQFSLQPGESVYLGKDPQQAGASITLSGATSRVSRTAAKVTFQGVRRNILDGVVNASKQLISKMT